jgi:Flp pilus assembly pilin Flp
MHRCFRRFFAADRGSSAAEYGFVAGLVGIAVILGVLFAGDSIGRFYNHIGAQLSNAFPQFSKLR